jgi:hypothetical protein
VISDFEGVDYAARARGRPSQLPLNPVVFRDHVGKIVGFAGKRQTHYASSRD